MGYCNLRVHEQLLAQQFQTVSDCLRSFCLWTPQSTILKGKYFCHIKTALLWTSPILVAVAKSKCQ